MIIDDSFFVYTQILHLLVLTSISTASQSFQIKQNNIKDCGITDVHLAVGYEINEI